MINIKTVVLKRAVGKAIKGASLDKNLPLTNMLGITCKDKTLSVYTTDGINYLTMLEEIDSTEELNVTVPIEIFSKLVAKITSEDIELSLEGAVLMVRGNGNYKIELPTDQGGLIDFPVPNLVTENDDFRTIKTSDIRAIINSNKSSLAKNLTVPCLCGYYVDKERVVTTNEIVACFSSVNLMNDEKLLPSTLVDLLALTDSDTIEYHTAINDKGLTNLVFKTNDMSLIGMELGFKEQYPIQPLLDLLNTQTYKGQCKVPKLLLSNVIDRLYLFVDQYDKNSVTFTFNQTGLDISSRKMSGIETINYIESKEFTPYVAIVDVISLKAQLSSFNGEEVTICYGNECVLKLESENATYIMALLETV